MLGPLDKAAIVLMALDEDHAHQIVARLDEQELRKVGRAMVTLGQADAAVVEEIIAEFGLMLGRVGNLRGGPETAARLLRRVLPPAKAAEILDDITSSGSDVWAKLAQIQPQTLAGYLLNEAPQAVAVILARLPASHAAQVFGALPADRLGEVAARMVRTAACTARCWPTSRRPCGGSSSATPRAPRATARRCWPTCSIARTRRWWTW